MDAGQQGNRTGVKQSPGRAQFPPLAGNHERMPASLSRLPCLRREQSGFQRPIFSLFTPREGEQSPERFTDLDGQTAVRVGRASLRISKSQNQIYSRDAMDGSRPPCPRAGLARADHHLRFGDLTTQIATCQFGGRAVFSKCGCVPLRDRVSLSPISSTPRFLADDRKSIGSLAPGR